MEKDAPYIEKDVPYLVYQGTMARFERIIKRLIILLGLIMVLFVGYVVYDQYADSLYDYANVDLNSEDGGNASYVNGSGVISNGESDSQNKDVKE